MRYAIADMPAMMPRDDIYVRARSHATRCAFMLLRLRGTRIIFALS